MARPYNWWPPEKEALLTALYPTTPVPDLLQYFPGHTRISLYAKIRKIKLGKAPPEQRIKVEVERDKIIYSAGFFDGEGCITVRNNPKHRTWGIPTIIVVNTVKEVVDKFAELFGGSVYMKKADYKKNKCNKPAWQCTISGERAYQVLKLMLPYLIVKKDEALLTISFWEKRRGLSTRKQRVELGIELSKELKKLKKRESWF